MDDCVCEYNRSVGDDHGVTSVRRGAFAALTVVVAIALVQGLVVQEVGIPGVLSIKFSERRADGASDATGQHEDTAATTAATTATTTAVPSATPGPSATPTRQDSPDDQAVQFTYELDGPGALDLDRGRPDDPSSNSWDLAFIGPGYLVGPLPHSTMSVVPPNPTMDSCADALAGTRDPGITGDDLAAGVTFCAVTTEQDVAAVTVAPWAGGAEPLSLSWRLWHDE